MDKKEVHMKRCSVLLVVKKKFELKPQGRKYPDGLVVKTLDPPGGLSSIPGWGTKISHAMQSSQKIKK